MSVYKRYTICVGKNNGENLKVYCLYTLISKKKLGLHLRSFKFDEYFLQRCAVFKRPFNTWELIAFDEEERILIVSFLPKSLSWVLWTSAAGIDHDAM